MRNGFLKNERIGTTLPTAWSRPTHIPCKHDIPKYSADPAERILTTKREIRISAGRRTFRFNRHTAIAAGKRRTRRPPAAATAKHACPAPSEATTRIPARLGSATAAGPRRTAPPTAAPYDRNDKWSDRIHRSGTERPSFPLFLRENAQKVIRNTAGRNPMLPTREPFGSSRPQKQKSPLPEIVPTGVKS